MSGDNAILYGRSLKEIQNAILHWELAHPGGSRIEPPEVPALKSNRLTASEVANRLLYHARNSNVEDFVTMHKMNDVAISHHLVVETQDHVNAPRQVWIVRVEEA